MLFEFALHHLGDSMAAVRDGALDQGNPRFGQSRCDRLGASGQIVGQHLFDLAREQVALAATELDQSFERSIALAGHKRQ